MTAENSATPDYQRDIRAVADALLAHTGPIVVLSHENPDGDALGSVLGLTRALRTLGKTVLAPMTVPRYLQFLPQPGELSEPLTEWPAHALVAVLDVDNNDPARVAGADLSTFSGPVVNVDHHGTNLRRADAGVVDPSKPAAAMMVADVVDALGTPWNPDIATALMLGLNTDTGNFAFDSVSAETFACAARLRERGARLGWLNDQMRQNPRSYYLLLREVLGTLEFLHDGRVVQTRVDEEMLARAGATWEQVDNYVNMLRNAEGAQLAVMAKDYGDRVKFSLRSRGPVSAQNVAVALGGGGHVPAAGATFVGSYPAARAALDAAIEAELAQVDAVEPTA
ncbi:DHH family phosphoesterase [Deinococcus wulumuqiensis]|uniref:Phosphoesterase n=1 Tax=Deinococcus wulumuqiensis TaxID=980427 RepID=A0AAV4K0M5_9DEIO|nr:bifunctional oligoribonuclease/PAP phosphatase NrnA [Deinococcus wulumuqiensis]QII20689.1 bifunctional oligoribonuclease/PAP phosphatase NrnA [Deinococcus wulumuqiensis R12]GGI73465.1 phosphoesterase [Deinococcus wulumuqiensis]GGP30814.1 phosphoesterase [Deinococcus wulumuqiensis]